MKKNAQYIFYLHIFHQRLPNMVKCLFTDVIHDAIWFMNIHEQITHDFWLCFVLGTIHRKTYVLLLLDDVTNSQLPFHQ
jgi:hypothetical protein